MDKPLTAKQASFVQYYADSGSDTYNNIEQSMLKAGYSANYARHNCHHMLANVGISKANTAYRAKTSAKLEHNRTIAIDQLNSVVDQCNVILQAQPHNVSALSAKTGAIRELNAISNLHSSTVNTDTKPVKALTSDERKALQAQARALDSVKLVKDTG